MKVFLPTMEMRVLSKQVLNYQMKQQSQYRIIDFEYHWLPNLYNCVVSISTIQQTVVLGLACFGC